jgi:hypothetical protein
MLAVLARNLIRGMELFNRLMRFLKKPNSERYRLIQRKIKMISTVPFHFGKATFPVTFLAYQPDSYVHFAKHPEFNQLFKSFVAQNKINNAGDAARLWALMLNIKQVMAENVPGDFAELGVWRGNTASILAYYAAEFNRHVYLFDTFEGFDERDIVGVDNDRQLAFSDTSLKLVKEVIGEQSQVCEFVKGYFPATLTDEIKAKRFSVVSIDCDLYEPMKAGLDFFYSQMPIGGLLLLHDYASMSWIGATKAIDEFCAKTKEYLIVMPDKSGSAFIRKSK